MADKMSSEIILFEKAIGNVNSILKLTGLQLINKNNDKSFIARLRPRWFFCFVMLFFNSDFVAEMAWFLNAAWIGKPLVELTYPAPCMAHCILANVKAYFFLNNELHLNDLVSTLRTLQSITDSGRVRDEAVKELLQQTSSLAKITKIQYWLNIAGLAGFAILPFLIMGTTYAEAGRIELVMPFMVIYPFDVTEKHIWPFMYVRQMFTASFVVFMVLGPDSLYYACSTFIQIQFRYLHYDIARIDSEKTNGSHFRAIFEGCMERHKELIRCVNLMELIYSKSTLFNVVSSSMLICLTGFNITAIPSWPLMMPFIAFVFLVSGQILLFCYFGDNLMRASSAISDAAYNCQWYNADTQAKKDLLFVLTRAQKPCKLTAYGFSDINLKTFARILSTAWSYFALLSNVNERKTLHK